MPPETLAQRLLRLLEAETPESPLSDPDGADETAVARTHGLLRARDGSPPARLVEDHARLRIDGSGSAASDRALALALASFSAERERIRHAASAHFVHDVRNALGAITMTAQRWLRGAAPVTPADDGALLLRQAGSVRELLDALRRRDEAPHDRTNLLAPALADLASECRESLVELRAAHPGLALAFEAGAAAQLRFDAFRVREALAHLVGRSALRGAATVAVRVWGQPGSAGLTVAAGGGALEAPPERQWQERLAWLVVRQTARAHGGDVRDEGRATTLWLPADES